MANLQQISMLKVTNLRCGYKNTHGANKSTYRIVLDSVGFELEKSCLMLLAGRNGIGKSTIIKTLAGLQNPLHGEVFINNIPVFKTDAPTRAALVSVMFSTPPELMLTKTQDVILTGMMRTFSTFQWKLDKEYEIVKQCMETCNMTGFWDRDFASLSDGEKQKIMLARCLAQNTPVLLLDEPLAFLDYPSRREMLALLQKLCKEENKVILYSSHDLEIAMKHCDKMLFLESENKHNWFENRAEIDMVNPAKLFELA